MATNNSYDGRTKAGKNYRGKDGKGAYDHPHRDKDMALGLVAGMFKGAASLAKKSGKKSKSTKTDFSYDSTPLTPEEIALRKAEDDKWFKKNMPLLITVVLIGTILTILFWVWVISLF